MLASSAALNNALWLICMCKRLSGFGPVLEGGVLYHFISFYPILHYMDRVVLSLGYLSLRRS